MKSYLVVLSLALAGSLASRAQDGAEPHPEVPLLDAAGKAVDPAAADARPYSPKQTCGGCHDYDAIAGAYHFQMGAEKIRDDFGLAEGKPWILSDGQAGRQIHMSYLGLTRKQVASAAEIGFTPYQYAQACGVCHAGGGILERDRDGQPYEARQTAQPDLAESLDGDYRGADWPRSGVLEIDCLMCHTPNYDATARAAQLKAANFRWAATAGAGLATVTGAVKAGDTPTVKYDPAKVAGGTLSLTIARPTDGNCLSCHAEAEVKKRGHVWDGRQEDVHTAAGMQCIDCHPSGPDHQIAKGRSNEVHVRDDLDRDEVNCANCHANGWLGAGPAAHPNLPADHLQKIACVTCHVRDTKVTAVQTVDTLTGAPLGLPTAPEATKYGESFDWQPAYFRLDDGKLYAGNTLYPAWWGNHAGEAIVPLFLPETKRAFDQVTDRIADDNGDGKPEANTPAEIRAMLDALTTTLSGGRFADVRPAYVKGQAVWELVDGELRSAAHPQAQPLRWTFSHNVSKKERALGAGGCADCHRNPTSPFFDAPVLQDPYGEDGRPVTVPLWQALGLDRAAMVKPQVFETPQEALARAKAAGLPVVLSFRSSSCIPCVAMDRILAELRPRFAERVVFVDVSLDPERLDWKLLDRYGIRVKPTTFLLNGRGGVVTERLGVWEPEALAAELEKLLENQP